MSSPLTRSLDPRRTLLLVCDVQEKFRQATFGFAEMCLAINKMTRAADILEMPVIATEQNPKALGSTVSEVGMEQLRPHLNLGAHAKTKVSPYFGRMLKPVFDVYPAYPGRHQRQKDRYGSDRWDRGLFAFSARSHQANHQSHICVLQTTLDLLASDLRVFVLADAVSSVHKQEIPVALEVMNQAGAVITTSESLLFRLMHASEPDFKPFVQLVKTEKAEGRTQRALETFLGDSKSATS